MKFKILLAIFSFLAISSFTQQMTFSSSINMGVLFEKGSSSARYLPFTGTRFSLETESPIGKLDFGVTYQLGAFLGSCQALGINGLVSLNMFDNYHPRVGIHFELDFGDYIFFSTGGTTIPPIPLGYGGLVLQPLVLEHYPWRTSILDLMLLCGFTSSLPLRFKINFLTLTYIPGYSEKPSSSVLGLSLSTAISFSLSGNYSITYTEIPNIYLTVDYNFLEFTGYIQSLSGKSNWYELSAFRIGAELLLSPANQFYTPAIGLGYYYSTLTPAEAFYDPDCQGLYGVLKPLRFNINLSEDWDLTLSLLELRYSPLIPFILNTTYDQGNLMVQSDLIKIGTRYRITM